MSWIQKLYETYENCSAAIADPNDTIMLLPICHTTQMAQVEIVINGKGEFLRAAYVPADEARTVIPCTEGSTGRTNGPVPHPLCDKLQYIAGDYMAFGGSEEDADFDTYRLQLQRWCDSPHSTAKARSVLCYVEKGQVIADLVRERLLFAGADGELLGQWDPKAGERPAIYKKMTLKPGETFRDLQLSLFMRFRVESPGDLESAPWLDRDLQQSWIDYYTATKQGRGLCYVTGRQRPLADQHPAKLRSDGDKAKLLSANDCSGFTFRGRFQNREQASGVGFDVTQKAHNALRWLIGRQNWHNGNQCVVAWATSGADIPALKGDSLDLLDGLAAGDAPPYTAEEFAWALGQRLSGYSAKLGSDADIVLMVLNSATPGRMSITYYREFNSTDFLDRVAAWHLGCRWAHDYRTKTPEGSKKPRPIRFVGAPAPKDIIEAAYGRRVDDNLRKAALQRLLPCIAEGRVVPRDIVDCLVRRASNRAGLEDWEWRKALTIACSLYKKTHSQEEYDLALDETRTTRDYLYGRLLAVADEMEQRALFLNREKRQTNAARLMQRFAERPLSTWSTIHDALTPYRARLGKSNMDFWLQRHLEQIMGLFRPEDFTRDDKLSGEYLLGYYCQLERLHTRSKDGTSSDDSNGDTDEE